MIVHIKKRYAYTIIGLLVLAVGVFIVNALTPGVAPNPGHLISQVAPPAGCGSGQVLGWSGSSWGCVDMSSGEVSTCSDCDSIYYTQSEVYTKSETYTKEQINAIISVLELGGTGCPVGYTLYEQSTETAKCYKDGEVIKFHYDYYPKGEYEYCWGSTGWGCDHLCEARIVDGIFQTRATYDPGTHHEICSGWVNGVSEAYNKYYTNYKIKCTPDWSKVEMKGFKNGVYYKYLGKSSWGNILQIQ